MKKYLLEQKKYAGLSGKAGQNYGIIGTFSKTAIYLMIALFMVIGYSCSKDEDEEEKGAESAYFYYGDHSYLIVKQSKTWVEAAADAVAQGGYLVEIGSQAEQTAVYQAIQNSGISTTYAAVEDGGGAAYIWIGATDKAAEGDWLWNGRNGANGTLFWKGSAQNNSYFNWGGKAAGTVNEPDDYEGQDAAAIGLAGWPVGASPGLGRAGEWNDIDESNRLYYVIEFDEAEKTDKK
ncbi:MAG: C-type lectin domain-containing protein [Prevotellaceae bacterium]|jgi:hypothetical protein|nr:C-type lectin domain-containing protein [Prevotellaceae bacterium]